MRVGILSDRALAASSLAGLDFGVNPTPIYILGFQSVSRIFAECFSFARMVGISASSREKFANTAGSFSVRSTSHGKTMNHITQRVAERLPEIIKISRKVKSVGTTHGL
jgi:hypothetical protein